MNRDRLVDEYFRNWKKEISCRQETDKENDWLAGDNLRLQENNDALRRDNDFCRKSKEKLYKALQEMTLKHSRAVCSRGEMERRLERRLEISYDRDSRIQELQEAYDLLEKSHNDENNELKSQIVDLGKELTCSRKKYNDCYQYLISQAQHKAEDASSEWKNIEYGEYPWETS